MWTSGSGAVGAEPSIEGEPIDVAVADALHVDPGATCLEHDRLTEQVVGWLERDELDPRLTIVVEGDPIEVRTLHFTLHDRGQEIARRDFAPGPSRCEDLHSVVALAIALAVDATVLESVGITEPEEEVVPEPPEPEPSPPEPTAPVATPAPPPPSPGLDLEPRPRGWQLRARARGLVTFGAPPPVGGGGELGLEVGWRNIVDLQAGLWATTAGPQPIEDSTLLITLVAGRVDVCGGPRIRRLRPRVCGGVLGGSALAEGRGFVRDQRTAVPWVAMAFGGDLRIELMPRLDLSLGLDGLVTVVRPVFSVTEELQVRQLRDLPRFSGAFGLGFVVGLR